MKTIEHKKKDVTDKLSELVPPLQTLQITIHFNEVTKLPETDDERKHFALLIGMGANPSKSEYYSVTCNPLLNSAEPYLLQHKEEIKKLERRINTSILQSKKCFVCGRNHEDFWYVNDFRKKTCDKIECIKLSNLLRWFIKRLMNKISKMDRRFECSFCNKQYQPTRTDTKFCSLKCRVASHRRKKE